MADMSRNLVLASMALAAGLSLPYTGQASSGNMAECRQEAEMYGVPPEQFEDYVSGCVASRGGDIPAESAGDNVPAAEADTAVSELPVEELQAVTGDVMENPDAAQ